MKFINDPLKDMIALIKENKALSYDDLALKLNKSKTTIKRNIQKLKSLGILRRVGSDKTGHWEIIEDKQNED